MAVGVEPLTKQVAAKPDYALLFQPVKNAMSYKNTSAQPTGVTISVPDTTTAGSVQDRTNNYSTKSTEEASPQQQLLKKRRVSKDKTSILRRSTSTPHMRNLAMGTNSELSPTGDKRRNKLGYHRTSVACGHCRRRKIRCLVANDEVTGRCANCIRLKKECNFYPVDQAPEPSRPHGSVSKEVTSHSAPSSSNTSSPQHPIPMSGAKVDEFRPPFPGAVPTNSISRYEIPSESDSEPHHLAPTSGLPVQQPAYGFPHPIDTQWPPTTGLLPSSTVSESPSSSTGYWRPSPTTAQSVYGSESNISGVRTPATMSSTSTMSYGSHQDGQNWGSQNFQPPSRSMSYSNIEGLPQHFQNQSLGVQQQEYRRAAPYPYPTSLDTSSTAMHSTTLGPQTSAPLSAPIVAGNPYNYPPPWNPYASGQNPGHSGSIQGRSMSGQWFAESGQLGQVQEEGPPPMTYGHSGMTQF